MYIPTSHIKWILNPLGWDFSGEIFCLVLRLALQINAMKEKVTTYAQNEKSVRECTRVYVSVCCTEFSECFGNSLFISTYVIDEALNGLCTLDLY